MSRRSVRMSRLRDVPAIGSVLSLFILISLVSRFANAEEDYRLGAGDLLRITAFGYPDLSTEVRVTQSGHITFPLVGELPVAGLSTRETEGLLAKRLTEGGFIPQAQISVLVTEYQSQMIAVMGQVAKPGEYPQSRSGRMLDVLAQAGGPIGASEVDGGAGDRATLLRHDGSKVDIDLAALLSGDPTQNPVVAAGDTIYVPKAEHFYIYGEVQHPGIYRLDRGMTVTRAVSASGGLTPRGSVRRTIIERHDVQGKEIKLSNVKADELIQPNDVIRIRQSLF